jgi:type IV secretion system protein TrbI
VSEEPDVAVEPQGPTGDPQAAVNLRGDPPKVMRLSRKAIGIACGISTAFIGGALIYALAPDGPKKSEELYNTDSRNAADSLTNAPKDYGQVPKLGAPLPGDLGKPILDAQNKGSIAAMPPVGTTPPQSPELAALQHAEQEREAARQRLEQESDSARQARVFFGGAAGGGAPSAAAPQLGGDAPASAAPAAPQQTDSRRAFLDRASDRRTASPDRLNAPTHPHILQAGSIIPAALITGIRSDLPGQITAQVTQNVYDSPTGRILLIPQGSRLIGDYDADVAFGQSRVLLAWNRLILPDGRSITLERQPGADPRGFAGLQDRTDFHWGSIIKAALVSTVLGVGAELGSGDDGNLVRALRRGSQDSINRAGEQIVSRELNVRPTLTIRPGFPVRVIVTRDLILAPTGDGQ